MPLLPCAQPHEIHYGIEENDDGKIIRYLRVVRLDLETEREGEKYGAEHRPGQPSFPAGLLCVSVPRSCIAPFPVLQPCHCAPVCEDYSGQHPRHESDCLHLGIVPHLDYLEVVGAEGDGYGSCDCQKPVHPEGKHQQESSYQGNEQEVRGSCARQQGLVDGIGPVSVEFIVHRDCRHSPEHGIGPQGLVIRVCCIVPCHFIGHSLPCGCVRLVEDFPGQHIGYERIRQCEEERTDADVNEYFLECLSVVFHLVPLFVSSSIRAAILAVRERREYPEMSAAGTSASSDLKLSQHLSMNSDMDR